MKTVYLVYCSDKVGCKDLCAVYADERLARLAAEGFVEAPRAWRGASCVHTGKRGWSAAYVEAWDVQGVPPRTNGAQP